MKTQTHAPSSAACNQRCLVQAWWPRCWIANPFGWRAPHQVTLVPVPVALARRPVVVELLAAQRQQGSGAARRQQGSSSSSKSGRGSGCSGRKGPLPKLLDVAREHQKLSRLCLAWDVYVDASVRVCVLMAGNKCACMESHLIQTCLS